MRIKILKYIYKFLKLLIYTYNFFFPHRTTTNGSTLRFEKGISY